MEATDAHGSESKLTEAVIGSGPMCWAPGFWTKVCERGIEPAACTARWERPNPYKGQYVEEYVAKCVDRFTNKHLAQCSPEGFWSGGRSHPEMDSSLLLTQLLRRRK